MSDHNIVIIWVVKIFFVQFLRSRRVRRDWVTKYTNITIFPTPSEWGCYSFSSAAMESEQRDWTQTERTLGASGGQAMDQVRWSAGMELGPGLCPIWRDPSRSHWTRRETPISPSSPLLGQQMVWTQGEETTTQLTEQVTLSLQLWKRLQGWGWHRASDGGGLLLPWSCLWAARWGMSWGRGSLLQWMIWGWRASGAAEQRLWFNRHNCGQKREQAGEQDGVHFKTWSKRGVGWDWRGHSGSGAIWAAAGYVFRQSQQDWPMSWREGEKRRLRGWHRGFQKQLAIISVDKVQFYLLLFTCLKSLNVLLGT